MAATVSIQETELRPAREGVVVRLYVSDRPRDAEGSAPFVLDLLVSVPIAGTTTIAGAQMKAIEAAVDALQGLRSDLYREMQRP
jgi:hypothetical protein